MSRRYRRMMLSCWGSGPIKKATTIKKCVQELSFLAKGKSSLKTKKETNKKT